MVDRDGERASLDRRRAGLSSGLTLTEQGRLAELEAVVERGLQTFVEVRTALMEIRNSRLYRATHPRFEDYLDERWGMSRSRGYRLMDAARVAELVSPIGDIPANEAQARELVPLLREGEEALVAAVPAGAVRRHADRRENPRSGPAAPALGLRREDPGHKRRQRRPFFQVGTSPRGRPLRSATQGRDQLRQRGRPRPCTRPTRLP
jgi:hypothetical protein